MAAKALPDDELEQLSTWPPEVARSDLAAHFTLSVEDLRWIRSHRGAAERIGLAVQLVGLGFLGFVPINLASTPREVVGFLAGQVGAAPATFARYAREIDAAPGAGTWPRSWSRPAGEPAGWASGRPLGTG